MAPTVASTAKSATAESMAPRQGELFHRTLFKNKINNLVVNLFSVRWGEGVENWLQTVCVQIKRPLCVNYLLTHRQYFHMVCLTFKLCLQVI